MKPTQNNQERTLLRSADFLRQVIDTIPGLVWSSLPDGHIDFLNQRWLDYTGLTLDEASGWGWQVAIHPGDLAGLVEYWKTVLKSGKPGESEARLRRFDGVHRWFLFRCVPLYDATGKLVKWYGTNTDIEDLKLAEMQIRRNKAYLAEAQRLSRTGSFGWNVATGELVWSQETFCILGYARDSKPGLELVLKRVHPEDVAKVQQTLDDAARESTNLDFEHRLLMTDGSVKYVHVLAKAVKAETGFLEFVGAVMDITERKNTEESLRRNETYLAEAQKLSKTGSFCLRSGGQEMICSEETVRIGGLPPGTKPTLEQAFERVHPEDRLRVQTTLGKALQEGSYLEYEHRLLMPDGSVRHVHTVANSIRTASGQVEYVGAVMDITESQKAAEALDAAEHLARGQLEALVGSLTTLSQEPKPEKFLEHVLHLICQQLGAEGIGAWEMNSKIGYVDLAANYENGRLLVPTVEEIQVLPQEAIAPKNHPVWEKFFRDGTSCVYGELNPQPPFC